MATLAQRSLGHMISIIRSCDMGDIRVRLMDHVNWPHYLAECPAGILPPTTMVVVGQVLEPKVRVEDM